MTTSLGVGSGEITREQGQKQATNTTMIAFVIIFVLGTSQ
jgi:hypothetical protein